MARWRVTLTTPLSFVQLVCFIWATCTLFSSVILYKSKVLIRGSNPTQYIYCSQRDMVISCWFSLSISVEALVGEMKHSSMFVSTSSGWTFSLVVLSIIIGGGTFSHIWFWISKSFWSSWTFIFRTAPFLASITIGLEDITKSQIFPNLWAFP